MYIELRKVADNDFEKDFYKLMNNEVFGKTMENIRKHRDIKLVTTDKKKRSKLVSQPHYPTINLISEDLFKINSSFTQLHSKLIQILFKFYSKLNQISKLTQN